MESTGHNVSYHLQPFDIQSLKSTQSVLELVGSKETTSGGWKTVSEVVGLAAVIVFVWLLLTVPIIFFHLPVNADEETVSQSLIAATPIG